MVGNECGISLSFSPQNHVYILRLRLKHSLFSIGYLRTAVKLRIALYTETKPFAY